MNVLLRGESLNYVVRNWPSRFYPSEWYRSETFAGTPHFGEFRDNDRPWPAVACALLFVRAAECGDILWPDKYVWTSDQDSEGNRVYIGRAAQYGGLQIHRLLTPEIEEP